MFIDSMPKGLKDYLVENIDEGNEVVATTTQDGYVWIINPGLNNWVIVIEWYENCKDYNIVNINGNSFKLVQRMMNEVKNA